MNKVQIQLNKNMIASYCDEAYQALAQFERTVTQKLSDSKILYVSEQDIDIEGNERWLYCATNGHWALFYTQEKRDIDAYFKMGIFPGFRGVLCHDHWAPYFDLNCQHSLSNDKLMAELDQEASQNHNRWSECMKEFLTSVEAHVNDAGGVLHERKIKLYQAKYRRLIKKGSIAMLEPSCFLKHGNGNCEPKSGAWKLLSWMRKYEDPILMFMKNKEITFSGNLAKDEIKRKKMPFKKDSSLLSGKRALVYCRIQSYLTTCRMQGENAF